MRRLKNEAPNCTDSFLRWYYEGGPVLERLPADEALQMPWCKALVTSLAVAGHGQFREGRRSTGSAAWSSLLRSGHVLCQLNLSKVQRPYLQHHCSLHNDPMVSSTSVTVCHSNGMFPEYFLTLRFQKQQIIQPASSRAMMRVSFCPPQRTGSRLRTVHGVELDSFLTAPS